MRSRNLFLRSLIVAGLAMSLSACSGSIFTDSKTDTRPRLPVEPSFMQAVPLPPVPPDESPKVTAFKARSHAGMLNSRLTESRVWYGGVRKSYGGR